MPLVKNIIQTNWPQMKYIIFIVLGVVGAANYCLKKSVFFEKTNIEKAYSNMSDDICVSKCQWTRISTKQLRFEGVIKPGSEKEFNEKISDEIDEIILNSGGGSVRVALDIATEIERRNLNITVNEFCLSSCANYLFLAGKNKKLNGVVGFHGSAGALDNYSCANLESDRACSLMIDEQRFFKRLGISTILFDITQSDSKGMNNGIVYAYYAPSKKILSNLGVKNLDGEQNKYLLDELNNKFNETGNTVYRVATDPNPGILKLMNRKE